MITPSDYQRIARAIEWLDAHAATRPALADAARAAGLSGAHFQRLFTRWAGISPKRFVQARTADAAVRLLRSGHAALETAFSAGLSGPARLHDLIVHAEALTPGDVRRAGLGVTITYGSADTPFGRALIGATPLGVCHLTFEGDAGHAASLADLQTRWPRAVFVRDDREADRIAQRAFPRTIARGGPLALHVQGTNFQLRVWKALLDVAPGTTTNYARVAAEIGAPTAARAVGQAVGANPISWLVPCHRVLRGDGSLGGYAWGLERKRTMLVWEGLRDERVTGTFAARAAR